MRGNHAALTTRASAGAALALLAAPLAPGAAEPSMEAIAFASARDVPAALAVPAGHRLVLEAQVTGGTQAYRCGADGKYSFLGPTAMLRGHGGEYVVHYFGPSWQFQDGSVAVGKVLAKAPRANAIDQLLLEIIQHEGKPGLFSDVAYVLRLSTTGGVAPMSRDPARDTVLAVPYTAGYQFWGPAR